MPNQLLPFAQKRTVPEAHSLSDLMAPPKEVGKQRSFLALPQVRSHAPLMLRKT